MNSITLMGRLTRDPELRKTTTEKDVATFSVAVEREFSKSEVDYFDCVAWGNEARFVGGYFHKGDMIALKGRGQFRDWTDRNGQNKRIFEVIVERAYFCGSKPKPIPDNAIVEKGFLPVEDDDGILPF